MVNVVDCHAGVLGSNPDGPIIFSLGITSPCAFKFMVKSEVKRSKVPRLGKLTTASVRAFHRVIGKREKKYL